MKLGASYNVFDGTELLEASIKSIRNNVDCIVVVYQNVSNYGEKTDNTSFVNTLVDSKLIDKVILYQPNRKLAPKLNETKKRNIGLNYLRTQKCSHHMNLDTDEFWIDSQLKYAKQEIIKHKYDATLVKNIRYYKFPTVQLLYEFNDYAPCIYTTTHNLADTKWKIAVDPSRKTKSNKLHIFKDTDVVMHHMWMIRKNMNRKFNNKSSKQNFARNLDTTLKFYENYVDGNVQFWWHGKLCISKINKVKNLFNISEDI